MAVDGRGVATGKRTIRRRRRRAFEQARNRGKVRPHHGQRFLIVFLLAQLLLAINQPFHLCFGGQRPIAPGGNLLSECVIVRGDARRRVWPLQYALRALVTVAPLAENRTLGYGRAVAAAVLSPCAEKTHVGPRRFLEDKGPQGDASADGSLGGREQRRALR